MRIEWRVALIWACFVARLTFYATVLPLWEGYDEWSHFAVIRTVAFEGKPLVARDQRIPRDVAESLRLQPVPWELRYLPWPSATEDRYWSLPPEARLKREVAFHAMPPEWGYQTGGDYTAYEALQPPLYYWFMAPVMAMMSGHSLSTQVLVLRWLSVLIASLIVPLIFRIGKLALGDDRLALCCAAVAAVMPGLALDVARVGNDCLAVLLFTLLIWLGMRQIVDGRVSWALGVVLGLGLLTKAYFLAAIPPVLLLSRSSRKVPSRDRHGAVLAILVAIAISGWWYLRNLSITGSLSGLSESATLRDVGTWTILQRAVTVPWRTAVDAILFSHVYFGGWSSLTVRSWMYHVFYLVVLAALMGMLRVVRKPAVLWLLCVYLALWAGQLYNVTLLFLTKGLAGSMGWYLYAVIAAEVTLCTGGLARLWRWAPAGGVALFALLDLYTIHAVAVPYYTGVIAHKANGAISAIHLANWRAVGFEATVERLTAFKAAWVSSPLMVAVWLVYLAATAWIVLDTVRRPVD